MRITSVLYSYLQLTGSLVLDSRRSIPLTARLQWLNGVCCQRRHCQAVGFLSANIAVKETSPLAIVALRALLSALICWTAMRAFGPRPPRTRQGWTALFRLGLLTGAIPFGTVTCGQPHIEGGMGGILFGAMPILAVVLAPLFLAGALAVSSRAAARPPFSVPRPRASGLGESRRRALDDGRIQGPGVADRGLT